MSRLQLEWQRLYGWSRRSDGEQPWINRDGFTRVMVLDLGRPVDWEAVAQLAQGVQKDLSLPAPAIAVNGVDGYQLWFALDKPVDRQKGYAFLQALCRHYGVDNPQLRVRCFPGSRAQGPMDPSAWEPKAVPAVENPAEMHWSAFVAPGLAALLAQEPWLDHPPSPEAQADLLSRHSVMSTTAFEAALAVLEPSADTLLDIPRQAQPAHGQTARIQGYDAGDPKGFLLAVMNDPSVPLIQRMDAAKSLLPFLKDG